MILIIYELHFSHMDSDLYFFFFSEKSIAELSAEEKSQLKDLEASFDAKAMRYHLSFFPCFLGEF